MILRLLERPDEKYDDSGVKTIASWAPFTTWRISPVKWLITVVNESPKDRVVGPLPNGYSWHTNGGWS